MQGIEGGGAAWSLPAPPTGILFLCRKHLQCVRGHLSSTACSLFIGYPVYVCLFSRTSRVAVCLYTELKRQVRQAFLFTFCLLVWTLSKYKSSQCNLLVLANKGFHDCCMTVQVQNSVRVERESARARRFCWVILWLLLQVTRTAASLHSLSFGKHRKLRRRNQKLSRSTDLIYI